MKEFLKKIFSPILIGNCLGMVLLTFVLGYGALYFLDAYTLHGKTVTIPDLKGMNVDAALSHLKELGLQGEVTDTGYVETHPGGAVLEQTIHPGVEVKSGKVVHLVINDWQPRKVALPAGIANNCSQREAILRLEARGLRVGASEYIRGDKNWVYDIKVNGQSVSPGTMISVKLPLTLVVGDGSVEEQYNGEDSLWVTTLQDSLLFDSANNDELLFE